MKKTFGFVGVGNMASAIIDAISSAGYIKPDDIYIYDPCPEKVERFTKCGMHSCSGSEDIFGTCTYVFLCVKPQVFQANPEQFRCKVNTNGINYTECIISIMAGVTVASIKETIGEIPVVRVMPNTPMLLGEGASALVKPDDLDNELFQPIFDIFGVCGKAIIADEEQISAITALSGSGPAYFFKFARAALKEAQAEGIEYNTALALLCQTMRGSAKMLEESGKTADELITMVTSPGGTTLAASQSFDQDDFEGAVARAMKACRDRALELGRN